MVLQRKYKKFFVLLIFILLVGCSPNKVRNVTYKNPIGEMTDIGDPFVLKVKDKYYMYATSAPSKGFIVWESDNLVDWEEKGLAYNHYDQEERWAIHDFWAPEVIERDGLFYMTYSARTESDSLRIAVATSESPKGPFYDVTTDLINEEGSYIDGHIFIDEDDSAYLYYTKDNYENIIDGKRISHMYAQKMSDDLLSLEGEPVFLFGPTQEWESPNDEFQWNEGAFVLKNGEKYYLMYSANFYGGPDYGIGYAVSESPLGPFIKSESNPILSSDMKNKISGPGHNSVTVGLDNQTLYAVYHVHTHFDYPSGDRRPAIDRLYFEDGDLIIDGPTSIEQELK